MCVLAILLLGTVSYRHGVSDDSLESAKEWSISRPASVPQEFADLAVMIMEEDGIMPPDNADKALILYRHLKSIIQ